MLLTIYSRIVMADSTLMTHPKQIRLLFKGTYNSHFLTPGLAFSLESKTDLQELDLLMQITGVMGEGWVSELLDKEVRLIIDFKEISRSDYRISIKAIGHKKLLNGGDDNQFIVLNSGMQLVSEDKAMEYIQNYHNK